MEHISKTKSKKLKSVIREYSIRLGLSDAGERFTTLQHIVRITSKFPKIAAFVRPNRGKVSAEQVTRMFEYMHLHPIGDFVVGTDGKRVMKGGRPTPAALPRENLKIKKRQRDQVKQVAIDRKREFYNGWDWRTLRYSVLKERGRRCECCGATPSDTDLNGNPVKIIVDHIKPISRYWHLRLDKTNLQILCDECNQGKGAWDETDWRAANDDEVPDALKEQLRYSV